MVRVMFIFGRPVDLTVDVVGVPRERARRSSSSSSSSTRLLSVGAVVVTGISAQRRRRVPGGGPGGQVVRVLGLHVRQRLVRLAVHGRVELASGALHGRWPENMREGILYIRIRGVLLCG